jgi:transcriptional regulator with XRE-family HTH domain
LIKWENIMADSSLQLHSPAEMAQQLAARVRADRLSQGWKQETLAARAGVSVPTLRRYERTGRTSVGNLLKICHALGRLDEFAELLKPPVAASIADLEARAISSEPKRKRGVR